MNLLLFIIILIVSFLIVRVGAIAFELTGLERTLAKFQALSCFTGTGFTTKEAELITGDLQRRRIASALMLLGHAGLVVLIATFANSLRTDIATSKISIPLLQSFIPSRLLPWVNLTVIIFAGFAVYKFFAYTKLGAKLTEVLRAHIVKKEIIKRVSFEELVIATGGYGVSKIEVSRTSPIFNKTLLESELRQRDITVLAVERNKEIITNPGAGTKLLLGDRLICFGKLGNIRSKLCVVPNIKKEAGK